jgi:phosphonate transport system substrate-binding protein
MTEMNMGIFAVCPHDTSRGIEKWTLLNTFVNRHVDLRTRFRLFLDFKEFGAELEQGGFLWAFLNPADYLKVKTRFGYVPVARPAGRKDVAYVVGPASHGANASLGSVAGRRLAAVKGYLFFLVLHRLRAEGVAFDWVPANSYAEVMKLVERGEADFGVTYNDHFDRLAQNAQEKYVVVARCDPGLSHVFAAHPSLAKEKRDELRRLLMLAQELPDGAKVLAQLEIERFEEVPEAPYLELQDILTSTS